MNTCILEGVGVRGFLVGGKSLSVGVRVQGLLPGVSGVFNVDCTSIRVGSRFDDFGVLHYELEGVGPGCGAGRIFVLVFWGVFDAPPENGNMHHQEGRASQKQRELTMLS